MTETLVAVILAGIFGMVGQGARAVVGLKGLADDTANPKIATPPSFSAARLLVSLTIGFIAGVIAGLGLSLFDAGAAPAIADKRTLLGLMAAGYAGTDFIEGFMARYLPGSGAGVAGDGAEAPPPQPAPQAPPGAGTAVSPASRVASLLPPGPAAPVGDGRVRAACEAEWEANKADCSAFVRAVGARLGATLAGNADQITGALPAGAPWRRLDDGAAAADAAAAGHFVVGGLAGQDLVHPQASGHVVVVVAGSLCRGKYPHAYWGRLNGVGARDQTVNWAWEPVDRDKVTYALYDP